MKKGIGKTAMSLLLAAAVMVSMPPAGGTILAAAGEAAGEALENGTAAGEFTGKGAAGDESVKGAGAEKAASGKAAERAGGVVPGEAAGKDGRESSLGKEDSESLPADKNNSGGNSENGGNQAGEPTAGENAEGAPWNESTDRNPAAGTGTAAVPGNGGTDGSPADVVSPGESSGSEGGDGSLADVGSPGGSSGSEGGDGSPADGESPGESSGSESVDGSPADVGSPGGSSGSEGGDGSPADVGSLGESSGSEGGDGSPADVGSPGESSGSESADGSPADGDGTDGTPGNQGTDEDSAEGNGTGEVSGDKDSDKSSADGPEDGASGDETLSGDVSGDGALHDAMPVGTALAGDADGMGVTYETVGDFTHNIYANGQPLLIVAGEYAGYAKLYVDSNGNGIGEAGEEITSFQGSGMMDGTGIFYWAEGGGYFLPNSSIYGGAKDGTCQYDTHVTLTGPSWEPDSVNPAYTIWAIYGGNAEGTLTGSTNVKVFGGNVKNIYGGSTAGSISGNTRIEVKNAQVDCVFGGNASSGTVGGDTELAFGDGAVVNGWTYGGGAGWDDAIPTEVAGSTNITINGGRFLCNVYGGGGWRGAKVGNSIITVNAGDLGSVWVYGGGEQASIVTDKASITVQGGTIGGVCASGAGFSNTEASVGTADIRLLGGTVGGFWALANERMSIQGDLSVTVSGDSFADTWLYFGLSDIETKELQTVSIELKDTKAASLQINSKIAEKLSVTFENASAGDLWLKEGVLAGAQEAALSCLNCGSLEGGWGVHIGGGSPGAGGSFEAGDNPLLWGSHLNKNKFTCMTFQNSYINYFDNSVTGDDNGPAACTEKLVVDGGALRLVGDMLTYMPPTQLLNDPLLIRTSAYREGIHFEENPEGCARIAWMDTDGTGIPDSVGEFGIVETPEEGEEEIFCPAADDNSIVYEMAERRDEKGNLLWRGRSWRIDLTENLCRCQVMSSSLKESIFPLPESGGGAAVILEDARSGDVSVSQNCPIFAHRDKAAAFTYTLLKDKTTAPGAALEGDSLKVDGTGAVHVEVGQNLNGRTFIYDTFVYFIRVPEKERYTFAQGMAEDISLSFGGLDFNERSCYIYNTTPGDNHGYVDSDKYAMTLENGILRFDFSKAYHNALPIGEHSFHVVAQFQPQPDGSPWRAYTFDLTIEIVAPTEVENPDIQLLESRFHYDGTAKEPQVVVRDGDTVIPTEEYTVVYQDNVNAGTASVTIANKPGGLYVVHECRTTFEIVNEYQPEKGRDYFAEPGENGWNREDFVVSAGEGRLLSLGNTASDDWAGELRRTEETGEGTLTFYVKDQETGRISLAAAETYRIDRTAPETFDIRFNGTSVRRLPADVSFGQFSREAVNVSMTAADALSGMGSIAYYQSGSVLTQAQLLEIKDWISGDRFTIEPGDGKRAVIYVKAADLAGNAVYYASEGVEFDLTPPAIGGVKQGNTYYTTQTVDVADRNLGSVALNGEAVSGSLTLPGNREAVYVIKAVDLAGNETVVTVSMKPISALAQALEGLTEENATSSDRAALESVRAVETDSAGATQEEKQELQGILDTCDRLLARIDAAQGELADVEDAVEGISKDTVQLTDQDALEKALEELGALLAEYDSNYTEAEKQAIEAERERIEEALESIEKVLETVDVIEKLPDPKDVSPDDLDTESAARQAKDRLDALTKHERSLVNAGKLKGILAALTDYRILEGDGSQWIQEAEGKLSFRANGAVEKFTGLLVDGEPVDTEHYTVKAGSTIVILKESYLDTLSAGSHSLTFRYRDGETSGGFTVYAKGSDAGRPDNGSGTGGSGAGAGSGTGSGGEEGSGDRKMRSPATGQ